MLRSAAVTLIKQRLQRDNDTAIDARIISEMQASQERLEHGVFLPWFLLSEDLSASNVLNDGERLPVPDQPASGILPRIVFLREYEEGALWIKETTEDNTKYIEMIKDDYAPIYKAKPGTGKPTHYALDGVHFRLRPAPDKVYSFKMKVYQSNELLTTDIENDWLKHASDLLVSETAKAVAEFHLRDVPLSQSFSGEIGRSIQRLRVFNEARKHANRQYTMGDED